LAEAEDECVGLVEGEGGGVVGEGGLELGEGAGTDG